MEIVRSTLLGPGQSIVKIIPQGSMNDISLIPALLVEFNNYFMQDKKYFIFDLTNVEELPPSFVALMFEVTAKARRKGGDVEVISLNSATESDCEQFRCEDYLSFGNSESSILAEFQDVLSEERINSKSARLADEKKQESIKVPSKVKDIYKVSNFVLNIAKRMGFDRAEQSKIKIAVYEGCLNAIEHAYHSDPDNFVTVNIEYSSNTLVISIVDFGEGFKQLDRGEYDVIKAAMERSRGGMGLHIIDRSMDKVQYKTDTLQGNRLIMTKVLTNGKTRE
jgi:serine/threonine-protein kinase RsbW